MKIVAHDNKGWTVKVVQHWRTMLFWVLVDTNTKAVDTKYLKKRMQDWLKSQGINGVELWLYTSKGFHVDSKYLLLVHDPFGSFARSDIAFDATAVEGEAEPTMETFDE